MNESVKARRSLPRERPNQRKLNHMRNILFPIFGAVIILAVFSSCTTTVRAPSGRSASISTHR